MTHPYSDLPDTAFWKPAVGDRSPQQITGLWAPKFDLSPDMPVATYGSCFAQHFSRQLVARGFTWLDAETPPADLDTAEAARLNYGVFSARTGNVYTTAALLQWIKWASGEVPVPQEVWERDCRYFDPFRPAIEPGGFATADALRQSQTATCEAFLRSIREAGIFVFTLGLTEAWRNKETGDVYAVCPGTLAGDFHAAKHEFVNYECADVMQQLDESLERLQKINPQLRVLLTVSPVPLTATASGAHVLCATTYSKSVLRAAAGQIAADRAGVDYFPSYEIITAPAFGGRFFQPNMRSVSEDGVSFVMRSFFGAIVPTSAAPDGLAEHPVKPDPRQDDQAADDLVCEEELLEAFAPAVSRPQSPRPGVRRIGVVGNSHVAALRRALPEALSAPADVDLAFWALPGGFQALRVLEAGVTHDDLDKVRKINGPDADVFDFRTLDGLVMMAEPVALPHILVEIARECPDLKRQGSPAFMDEVMRRIDRRVGMQALRVARECIDGPVIAVQQPMYRQFARPGAKLIRGKKRIFRKITASISRHLAQMGVTYIPQDPETLTPGVRTLYKFSQDATRSPNGDRAPDVTHMNQTYGAIVLDQVFQCLGATSTLGVAENSSHAVHANAG